MFCGNGGSAADSQHLATEMLIRLRGSVERPSWPALALTLDPAALTAGGNDYGYERVFERPLRGLGRAGDVLFGITTSGRSANVVRALRAAREMGIVTVGLLGGAGRAGDRPVRPRPAGARCGDGADPGMPHRARPRRAGIAGGSPGGASAVTVLLTGAAGFIGYHVAEALLARGERVIGVDNLNAYYDVRLKQARLARLARRAGFRVSPGGRGGSRMRSMIL